MKVAIVNYGFGNIGSVRRALQELRAEPVVAQGPADLAGADRIILPGVGAFNEAMACLHANGWVPAIARQVHEAGTPLLGICLGMQLLAEHGEENAPTAGLGYIRGRVRRDRKSTRLNSSHT